MIRIGCIIPGGSFMPQGDSSLSSAYVNLRDGTNYILQSGFDYAEAAVGMLMSLTPGEVRQLADEIQIEVCNCFIPGEYHLMENPLSAESYVAESMGRMQLLGTDTVVFGSGGARRVPPQMPVEDALKHMDSFLQMCERYAASCGITVALEPLNAPECGCRFMNRVEECLDIQRRVQLPHVKVLADIYHMGVEDEPFSVFAEAGDALTHVHFAEKKRTWPGSMSDGFVADAARALRASGYDRRVTAECSFSDFKAEAPLAAAYMKKILTE